jgi:hypothetical protein
MHIGIDFDNTLVCYDAVFPAVAREWGLLPEGYPAHKLAVRDHLRAIGQEDRWTEMQGHVYGARMDEAAAYPGAIEFIDWALHEGHTISIVSHKTRHPFLGPRHDLHAAARGWIIGHLPPSPRIGVFFELTKAEKLARIAFSGCDVFIDDLPEILLADDFPQATTAILFDPETQHGQFGGKLQRYDSWSLIYQHFSQS